MAVQKTAIAGSSRFKLAKNTWPAAAAGQQPPFFQTKSPPGHPLRPPWPARSKARARPAQAQPTARCGMAEAWRSPPWVPDVTFRIRTAAAQGARCSPVRTWWTSPWMPDVPTSPPIRADPRLIGPGPDCTVCIALNESGLPGCAGGNNSIRAMSWYQPGCDRHSRTILQSRFLTFRLILLRSSKNLGWEQERMCLSRGERPGDGR